ncbi:hypothetical protein BD779DRAFT_1675264 [Infundibulicybe gibba]|nr:hypothetical protein BD779DRAFT_1675264 [Infundibulicybe gibba]
MRFVLCLPSLPVISTTHPLTFLLRAQHEGSLRPRPPTPHFHIVFATLIATRGRWQSVLIILSAPPQSTIDAIVWGPSPMLRTFYCELVDTDGSGRPACLSRAQHTAAHTLDLYRVQYPEPEILRALSLTPALHTLFLDDNVVRPTTTLVYALHPAPRKAALCPLLRTLCLSGVDFLDSVCGAMVRARYGEDARENGVVALEHVRINFRRAVGPADRQVMRALRNEGMAEVNFSSW